MGSPPLFFSFNNLLCGYDDLISIFVQNLFLHYRLEYVMGQLAALDICPQTLKLNVSQTV